MPTRTTPAPLGALLRAARARTGMTQEQLAGLSTVSVRTIRDLEQGRVAAPRRETIRLLADAMRLGRATRAELERATGGAAGDRALPAAPVPLHPLFGRREEVRALSELLGTRQTRLLTLTGLSGAGKSRLAQELANTVRDRYATPAVWVAAAAPAHPRTVVGSVAFDGDAGGLATVIGDRAMLLVLDGIEPRGADACRLDHLLTACEGLTVLVTTRAAEPGVGGAQAPVPGLATDPGRPGGADVAVELLLHLVRCRHPGLSISAGMRAGVAETCSALDGLPGALEQAADWLLLLPPDQVREMAVGEPLGLVGDALAEELRAALPAPGSALDVALERLAAVPRRRTFAAAVEALAAPPAEAARALRDLLLRGLVRRVPAATPGGLDGFEVLNLVRHAVAGRRQAVVPAPAAPLRAVGVVA